MSGYDLSDHDLRHVAADLATLVLGRDAADRIGHTTITAEPIVYTTAMPDGDSVVLTAAQGDQARRYDTCTHEIIECGSCAGCGEPIDTWRETPPSPRAPGCQGRGWFHDGSEQEYARETGALERCCPDCGR